MLSLKYLFLEELCKKFYFYLITQIYPRAILLIIIQAKILLVCDLHYPLVERKSLKKNVENAQSTEKRC